MRKRYILIIFCCLLWNSLRAQSKERIIEFNVREASVSIANSMRDSLRLDDTQYQQIIDLNIQIQNQKLNARKSFAGNDSLMQVNVQRAEDRRNDLYKSVLTEQQYLAFLKQKRLFLKVN